MVGVGVQTGVIARRAIVPLACQGNFPAVGDSTTYVRASGHG